MTIARKRLVDPTRPGWYHCVSRCVRRAFLCGDGFEHRKEWVRERLEYLSRCFSVEIAAYAVMSNHLHVVARIDPVATQSWSALEVARRWLSVYPQEYLSDGTPVLPADSVIEAYASNPAWVEPRRKRLGELGWFMKALKEPIARRANREDSCTGAFWEGRFKSIAILDQAALMAVMAYVDLNPIRAGMADRPERSTYTSGQDRIHARQHYEKLNGLRERAPKRAAQLLRRDRAPRHSEDGLWLAPLKRCLWNPDGERGGPSALSVEDYLSLLDATGRLVRDGKGAIPPHLAAIVHRLDLDTEAWLATMLSPGMMLGAVLCRAAKRTDEARRRGLHWLRNRCPLFAKPAEERSAA